VSTVLKTNEEKFSLLGIAVTSQDYRTALVQPEGIGQDFSAWVKEVTRAQFLYPNEKPGVGHAITHAKMIVIDPFDEDCKVITGSHNFSKSASEKNDENFVVIQGHRALAEAYAVACLATYESYRWRAYVKEMTEAGKPMWAHLRDQDDWQTKYLTSVRRNHLAVWCRWE
jgi:phosphatidylserine/phosphatidylglycerophosphate/cardiolipin synthase-like enzyme